MGGCASQTATADTDPLLASPKQRHVLLLGTGNAGKSTLLKNAIELFGESLDRVDVNERAADIQTSIVSQARALVSATAQRLILEERAEMAYGSLPQMSADMPKLVSAETQIRFAEWDKAAHDAESKISATMTPKYSALEVLKTSGKFERKMLKNFELLESLGSQYALDADLAETIQSVVSCAEVDATYDSSSGLTVGLFANYRDYFFRDVVRFASPLYRYKLEDSLMHCTRTTGMMQVDLCEVSAEDIDVTLTDTGGQRSERKKWITVMQNVWCTAVLVDVTCFDKTLLEDASTNAMDESLELFELLADYRALRNTPLLLFLNKVSLLAAKLRNTASRTVFEEYFEAKLPNVSEEKESDMVLTQSALTAIRDKFMSVLPSHRTADKVLSIEGDAIEPQTVRDFFDIALLSGKRWSDL